MCVRRERKKIEKKKNKQQRNKRRKRGEGESREERRFENTCEGENGLRIAGKFRFAGFLRRKEKSRCVAAIFGQGSSFVFLVSFVPSFFFCYHSQQPLMQAAMCFFSSSERPFFSVLRTVTVKQTKQKCYLISGFIKFF